MSIGLLAGSVAKTEEAAIGMSNFVVLPMAFLSGSFFSLDGSPHWIEIVGKAFRSTISTKGCSTPWCGVKVRVAVVPIAILLGFAAVVTAVAARLFRWDD